MKIVSALFLVFCLIPTVPLAGAREEQVVPRTLHSLGGAWKEPEAGRLLFIEEGRIVTYQEGRQSVKGIVGLDAGVLTVRDQGLKTAWRIAIKGSTLQVGTPEGLWEYIRLTVTPREVLLEPFKLGSFIDLPSDRIKAIQENLRIRLKKDQDVLKAGGTADDPVLADNLRFLKALVQEVGWVDAARFGRQASADAILIAKHGNDLSLMMAILPYVEKDFKLAGDDAQMFTVLYDGLQLDLGLKQRYGTQLGVDASGEPMVLPLENLSKTDEFRKELGLAPLAEYLDLAGKTLFKGKKIRLPGPDE